MKTLSGLLGAFAVGVAVIVGAEAAVAAQDWPGTSGVIVLTQVGCQFLEPENGIDRGFETAKSADCEKINAETGAQRLAAAKVLRLKPGKYIFRVINKDVPYELGFWLREKDYDWRNPLHRLSKISVSGGGLTVGKSQDYEIELEEGEYLYSCPLNPTPNYRLIVAN